MITRSNTIGILLSVLIGAAMAAGVMLTAPTARATPQQDREYYTLLEQNGMTVTDTVKARNTGYAICQELDAGTPWRRIITALMDGADWDLDSAAVVFAVAITVYCPSLYPPELADAGNIA